MIQQCIFYIVDLTKSKLKAIAYPKKDLEQDLLALGVGSYKDLSNYDFRFFKSKKEADDFIEKFELYAKKLKSPEVCKSKNLPCLLYKRRYLIQTLMGEKNITTRTYNKEWSKGQLFNLYDQTHFLTVMLKEIKKIHREKFEYHFEVI